MENSNQENQLKSKKIDKKIIIIMILILIILTCIYLYSPFFKLEKIEILGDNTYTADQIIAQGNVDTTKNIYLINTKTIEENIKQNPYVQEIKIKRKFPTTLTVEIYERKPIATISFSNKFAMIDGDGNILKIEEEFANTVRPLIMGVDSTNFVVGEKINVEDEKLNKVSEIVKNAQSVGLIQSLSQIDVSDTNNISMVTTQGITVLLGNGEKVNEKMLKLNQILVDLNTKGKTSGVVDMRYDTYPVYRPE